MKTRTAALAVVLFGLAATPASAHHFFLHELEKHHPNPVHDLKQVEHTLASLGSDGKSLEKDLKLGEKIAQDVSGPKLLHIRRIDPLRSLINDEQKVKNEQNNIQQLYHDEKKLKCDRMGFFYYLEHPPGTEPQGLKGKHGCAKYEQNRHWHERHPNVISILGANIGVGMDGGGVSF